LKNVNLFWKVNEQIRAPEVRVIGKDGKLLGVMKIGKALDEAKKDGLTLVEIAGMAKPPVVKIVEFGKFRYQEEKKYKAQLKKSKVSELKEVRFSPFIAENDYNTRLRRVEEFLTEKDKVKLTVTFTGRQMGSKPFGYALLKRINQHFGEGISIDMEPKFLGRNLMMIISPVVKKLKIANKEVKEEKKAKK
jgi:translation initiation factor IF-3